MGLLPENRCWLDRKVKKGSEIGGERPPPRKTKQALKTNIKTAARASMPLTCQGLPQLISKLDSLSFGHFFSVLSFAQYRVLSVSGFAFYFYFSLISFSFLIPSFPSLNFILVSRVFPLRFYFLIFSQFLVDFLLLLFVPCSRVGLLLRDEMFPVCLLCG